jgi:hypothetical protein
LARQPPQEIGHCAASSGKKNCWGTIRGGGGGKIGGTGPGDEFSYMMGLRALMDDEGRHCPMTAMGPHSCLLSIQQSAYILCNRTMMLKLEKNIINNVY